MAELVEPEQQDSVQQRRKPEDVIRSAEAAGLVNTDGPIQLLHFSEELNSEDVKLLEVPSDVLESLQCGRTVVIRGEPSEDAVLCTDDKSYELRLADTSNALLISPSMMLPKNRDFQSGEPGSLISKEVVACLNNYYELRPCPPKTEKLKHLLNECPYRGPELEDNEMDVNEEGDTHDPHQLRGAGYRGTENSKDKPRKYTFHELLDLVQASESELVSALGKIQACCIDGYWRVFDLDYRDRVFRHILNLLEEKDWSYGHVPLGETCDILEELEPRFAIEHCLSCYGDRVDDSNSSEVYVALSEDKVCQYYAELLLRPAEKFNYHEFMESWKQSVPDGMTADLKQLEGLVLVDLNGIPPVIWYYPVSELPQNPTARFNKLFSTREKWMHSQIQPFIRDLQTPTQSLNALLLKHARVSTGSRGEKVYNARRTNIST